ncbi:winged helix-turn-helix domain-containing protein [Brevundimonas sp.]|uniref:winged helix-turn-helix domain-containing protein n=1 Tax=Brevundimonas sp. TaxID=1871086 RepID=UPI003D0E4960
MSDGVLRFGPFLLDPRNRRLTRDGATVELNARYLDALVLLVGERGGLVSKTRFLDEVWRGVPVTDEALTQCIRSLRRALGDDATNPRFIETSPKHGYRFIAPVDATIDAPTPLASAPPRRDWETVFRLGRAGMIGGGAAGLLGGFVYGFVGISEGGGSVSALLVIACLTMVVGLMGGAGVGFGIAASTAVPGWRETTAIPGGAAGGLLVGAVVKMVGLDAFTLLFGQSPGAITGAPEGALLGGAVGLGFWLSHRRGLISPRRSAAITGVCAAVAGVLIGLCGGRLMGGSLDLLADRFPGSSLRLDHLGRLFGEADFGRVGRTVTAGLEGLLFGAGVAFAMTVTRRRAARAERDCRN